MITSAWELGKCQPRVAIHGEQAVKSLPTAAGFCSLLSNAAKFTAHWYTQTSQAFHDQHIHDTARCAAAVVKRDGGGHRPPFSSRHKAFFRFLCATLCTCGSCVCLPGGKTIDTSRHCFFLTARKPIPVTCGAGKGGSCPPHIFTCHKQQQL